MDRDVVELAAAGRRNVLEFVPAGGKPWVQSVELCPRPNFRAVFRPFGGGGFVMILPSFPVDLRPSDDGFLIAN